MKILHVLNSSSYSGAENVVISIINSTKDRVESVYLSRDGAIREQLVENKIDHYLVDKLTRTSLNKAVEDIKPDVIHAHDFTAGVLAASIVTKIPIVSHLHNNSPWIKRFCPNSILYAIATLRFKKILTVSESIMEEFIFSGICKRKAIVVGNPIDTSIVREKSKEQVACEAYEIAVLGRLAPPKNPSFFLELMAELKKESPEIRACMIGDGELRHDVEQRITELQLEDNVKLLGFQKNPYAYLDKAKILCMPSLWEGFGLAAIEALALGKPVVATPVGGLVDIITDDCGKLCKNKDVYVDEIQKLLKDDIYYNEKSKASIERARVLENKDVYMNGIYDMYQKLWR